MEGGICFLLPQRLIKAKNSLEIVKKRVECLRKLVMLLLHIGDLTAERELLCNE